MKLELKHLAPYLPYGLKVLINDGVNKYVDYITSIGLIDEVVCFNNTQDWYYGQAEDEVNVKPILHPLSNLTKKIIIDGIMFNPCEEMFKGHENIQFTTFGSELKNQLTLTATYTILGDAFTDFIINRNSIKSTDYWIVEKLLELKFDVFGLIESGLAIDVNTLDSNPY